MKKNYWPAKISKGTEVVLSNIRSHTRRHDSNHHTKTLSLSYVACETILYTERL
jgi:hypothetical protein